MGCLEFVCGVLLRVQVRVDSHAGGVSFFLLNIYSGADVVLQDIYSGADVALLWQ